MTTISVPIGELFNSFTARGSTINFKGTCKVRYGQPQLIMVGVSGERAMPMSVKLLPSSELSNVTNQVL